MSDPLGLINAGGASRPVGPVGTPSTRGANPAGDGPSFKDVLMKNIEEVNRLQQDAQRAVEDLATGRRDDVASVVIAQQKAKQAFELLVQVRNKMLEAYDEIKQMRV